MERKLMEGVERWGKMLVKEGDDMVRKSCSCGGKVEYVLRDLKDIVS